MKCISRGNALLFLGVFFTQVIISQSFDPLTIEKEYPNERFVLLNYDVKMELSIDDDGNPIVKTNHKKEYLTLKSDVSVLNRFLLTFSETQEIKVKLARVYQYVDGKKKLVNNVKTRWLKSRDHFIQGVFFNDIKDLEIVTERRLGKYTHITLEYEVIDHDTKFVNPIYVASYGEHVIDFKLTLVEPYDAVIEVVPFNVEGLNYSQSSDKGNSVFTVKESPRLKTYPNDPPYNYIAPHFVPVVREIEGAAVLKTESDLYKWYKSLIKEVDTNSQRIKDIASKLTASANSEEEKIEAIFQYVQDHIDYLAFEDGIAGFKPENAENVLVFGYGDCKGMSNLLVDLLKNSGIECGHAWVGTRRLNYSYNLASLCVDNHMVSWVKLNDELYILDATGKNHKWNIVPSHLQGKELLIGKGDDFEIINIPISDADNNLVSIKTEIYLNNDSGEDEILGEIKLTGNEALDFYSELDSESVQSEYASGEWIVNYFLGASIESLQVENINYDSDEIELSLSFKGILKGAKIKNEKDIWLYTNFSESFIQIVNPELPSFFQNKIKFLSELTVHLKDGAKIHKIPENYNFNSDEFSISYQVLAQGNEIKEKREMVINTIYSDVTQAESRIAFSQALNSVNKTPIKILTK